MSKWKSKRVLAGVVAGLAVAGAGGAGLAAAQSEDPAGPAGSPETFLADVAERLGVTEEQLRDAMKAEGLERLDALVAQGIVPEDRAAAIRERIEAGKPPLRPPHGPRPHGPLAQMTQTAADFLGLTPAEILDELREGNSLAEIAQAHGKTAAGLVQALLAEAEEHITRLVNSEPPLFPPPPPPPEAG